MHPRSQGFLPSHTPYLKGKAPWNRGWEYVIKNLSLCHWNLNGIAAYNCIKISLLEAYITVHDFDIICVSETFLDSSYSNDVPKKYPRLCYAKV